MFIGIRKRQNKYKGMVYNIYACESVNGKRQDKYLFKLSDDDIKNCNTLQIVASEMEKHFTGKQLDKLCNEVYDKLHLDSLMADDYKKKEQEQKVNEQDEDRPYLFNLNKLTINRVPIKRENMKYERVTYYEYIFSIFYGNNPDAYMLINSKETLSKAIKNLNNFIEICAKDDGIDINKRVYKTYRKQLHGYLMKEIAHMEFIMDTSSQLKYWIERGLKAEHEVKHNNSFDYDRLIDEMKRAELNKVSALSKQDYRVLLKVCHPDNGGSDEAMQILNRLIGK